MLKPLAREVLFRVGLPSVVRATRAKSLRILMYHRFKGSKNDIQAALEKQCRHLRKHYELLSFTEIGEILASKKSVPDRALTVTVDDGYADFALGWSVFRSFHIPVTLYVVSGFLDRKLWLWPDVVQFAIRKTALSRLDLHLANGARYSRSLEDRGTRWDVTAELCRVLIAMPNVDRQQTLARLQEAAGVTAPPEIPEEYAPLSWEALHKFSQEGLELGAHTITHPLLSRLADTAEVQREVAGSRERIEAVTGVSVRHFCYPNGQAEDYTARTTGIVREAGFLTGVNARRGTNRAGQDRFDLFRIGCDPGMPFSTFELDVAGFRMP